MRLMDDYVRDRERVNQIAVWEKKIGQRDGDAERQRAEASREEGR